MRFLFLILFFFLNWYSFSQTSEIQVEYSQAIGKTRDKVYKNAKKLKGVSYILKANQTCSTFEAQKFMSNDIKRSNEHYIYTGGANGFFYNNLKTDEKLRKLDFMGEDLIIHYSKEDLNWEITNEKKMISQFECIKAISIEKIFSPQTGEQISVVTTAWFAPEISFPFGPRGTDGLPGLILEVSYYNDSLFFIAEKISLFNYVDKKNFDFQRPDDGKELNYLDYLAYIKNKVKNRN